MNLMNFEIKKTFISNLLVFHLMTFYNIIISQMLLYFINVSIRNLYFSDDRKTPVSRMQRLDENPVYQDDDTQMGRYDA